MMNCFFCLLVMRLFIVVMVVLDRDVRVSPKHQHPMVVLCDGHGGDQVASYTVNQLFDKVEEAIEVADSGQSKLTALIEDCVDQIEDEMRLHLAASSHSQEAGSQSLLPLREHSTPRSEEHPSDLQ